MKGIKKQFLFVALQLCLTTFGFSQHQHSSQISTPILHHEIDVFIGNSHIPDATSESSSTLVLPNIGINYKYWFNERFALGSYNNLVARTFVVNNDEYNDYEIKYPFVTTVVGVFRPWKNLGFFAGPGALISDSGNFFIVRLGLDYEFTLSNNWYVIPRFMFDSIGGDIESYTLGIAFGKNF